MRQKRQAIIIYQNQRQIRKVLKLVDNRLIQPRRSAYFCTVAGAVRRARYNAPLFHDLPVMAHLTVRCAIV